MNRQRIKRLLQTVMNNREQWESQKKRYISGCIWACQLNHEDIQISNTQRMSWDRLKKLTLEAKGLPCWILPLPRTSKEPTPILLQHYKNVKKKPFQTHFTRLTLSWPEISDKSKVYTNIPGEHRGRNSGPKPKSSKLNPTFSWERWDYHCQTGLILGKQGCFNITNFNTCGTSHPQMKYKTIDS